MPFFSRCRTSAGPIKRLFFLPARLSLRQELVGRRDDSPLTKVFSRSRRADSQESRVTGRSRTGSLLPREPFGNFINNMLRQAIAQHDRLIAARLCCPPAALA